MGKVMSKSQYFTAFSVCVLFSHLICGIVALKWSEKKSMKNLFKAVILFSFAALCLCTFASAHSGRTDEAGGHYDRSTGEYHYHHGKPAHQHPNGICPYDYDDRTKPNANIDNHNDNDKPDGWVYKENKSASDYIQLIVLLLICGVFIFVPGCALMSIPTHVIPNGSARVVFSVIGSALSTISFVIWYLFGEDAGAIAYKLSLGFIGVIFVVGLVWRAWKYRKK